jgi:hypothetical protein
LQASLQGMRASTTHGSRNSQWWCDNNIRAIFEPPAIRRL